MPLPARDIQGMPKRTVRTLVFTRAEPPAVMCRSGMQRDQRHAQAGIFKQLSQALFDLRQIVGLLRSIKRIYRAIYRTKATWNMSTDGNFRGLACPRPQCLQRTRADALIIAQCEFEQFDL